VIERHPARRCRAWDEPHRRRDGEGRARRSKSASTPPPPGSPRAPPGRRLRSRTRAGTGMDSVYWRPLRTMHRTGS